jgi:hypothetical protein
MKLSEKATKCTSFLLILSIFSCFINRNDLRLNQHADTFETEL